MKLQSGRQYTAQGDRLLTACGRIACTSGRPSCGEDSPRRPGPLRAHRRFSNRARPGASQEGSHPRARSTERRRALISRGGRRLAGCPAPGHVLPAQAEGRRRRPRRERPRCALPRIHCVARPVLRLTGASSVPGALVTPTSMASRSASYHQGRPRPGPADIAGAAAGPLACVGGGRARAQELLPPAPVRIAMDAARRGLRCPKSHPRESIPAFPCTCARRSERRKSRDHERQKSPSAAAELAQRNAQLQVRQALRARSCLRRAPSAAVTVHSHRRVAERGGAAREGARGGAAGRGRVAGRVHGERQAEQASVPF